MLRRALVLALVLAGVGPAHALEVARPMGMYRSPSGPALAMLDSQIDVTVRGPIVEVEVIQRFSNPGDRATEATYIFPLPADAAVSAMELRIGRRAIRGAIEVREAAQRRYEAAIAAGVAGALLEHERPDVFTQSVAAIPPGGVVEVRLRYDTVARYQAGRWELVLPMVVAPRYVPGTASGLATTGSGRAPDTDRAPDASRITPAPAPGGGGPTAVTIHFVDPPSELTSPSHSLGGTASDATLSDPHSDRDAIVRWRAQAPAAGWVEHDGNAGFAAVVVEAPPVPAAPRRAGRVILAIDRAATTRGDADVVERPLVRALCGLLDAGDRVRVIRSDLQPAGAPWAAPAEALRGLERGWAAPAPVFDLTRVLQGARPDGAPIVLVSDGLVADDPAVIAAARRLGVPIHVIGIGPAPARATLQQIAAVSGGTVRYAVAGDDPTPLVRAVLADVATPPAPLAVTWGTLGAVDVEPAGLPRLGAGQAMLVLARVQRVEPARARSRGQLFAFELLAPQRPVDGALTALGPLARRWARERLGDLIVGGRDRAAIESHALRHGLVSPYTSLVAIGSEVVVSGGVTRSVAVPVSLPAGMQWPAVRQALDVDTGAADQLESTLAPADAPAAAPSPAPVVQAPPARRHPPSKAPPAHRPPSKDDDGDDDKAGHNRNVRAKKAKGSSDDREQPAAPEPAPERESARRSEPVAAPPPPARAVAAARSPTQAKEEIAVEDTGSRIAGVTAMSDALASTSAAEQRRLRLSAALGGGLAIDRGARGLLALDVRLDVALGAGPAAGRRWRAGGEAALWLVGATEAQGRALVTLARELTPRIELGLGAGLHVGDGTGPAGSLRLGIATPLRPVAAYLRYDAAVLVDRPSLAAEHAITLGLELSY